MTQEPAAMERLSSGSPAFDRILGGGLPLRSLTVVAGEPGAGKTLFALQTLFNLTSQGRKCLYFTTLSEPAVKLAHHMQKFTFFNEKVIGKELVFVDLGSAIREHDADAALDAIVKRIEREEPAVVVIDSFKAMRSMLGDEASVRTFVYDLAVHVAGWGAATLFIGEYLDHEIMQFPEFAIADGILRFSTSRQELTSVRMIEVLKLRGADCVTGRHFFEIGVGGLTFYPRVRGPEANGHGAMSGPVDRASSGVAGIDDMLGGGLPRSSSTVVQGGTGTGKTLLGLQFLIEGARRGEPGILFTLEETPDQLRGIAQGFGWDLGDLEKRGLLWICHRSPVELSTDAFLNWARQRVEEVGARRAVLDSLTSMALGVPSERRFKELVYAIAKHFRALGVTFNMNMEVAELLGTGQLSGQGISFAADNMIQLRYVEVDGKLERGISILKARGIRHTTEVHRVDVSKKGVEVGSPFKGLRGVLTGLPTPLDPK